MAQEYRKQGKSEEYFRTLDVAAKMGHPEARHSMAWELINLHEIRKDPKHVRQALKCWHIAVENGQHLKSMFWLGYYLLNGIRGTQKNVQEGMTLLQKVARSHSADEEDKTLIQKAKTIVQDKYYWENEETESQIFLTHAEGRREDLELWLGGYYLLRNEKELARAHFQEALHLGNAKAAVELQNIKEGVKSGNTIVDISTVNAARLADIGHYLENRGKKEEAMHFFKLAGERQNAEAEVHLQSILKHDPKDAQLLKALKNAAENGDVHAQWQLSNVYHAGSMGAKRDHTKAHKWLLKAANGGFVRAFNELAVAHLTDYDPTEYHFDIATKWAEKGAKHKDLLAIRTLAKICCLRGNFEEGQKWLKKLVEFGDPEASKWHNLCMDEQKRETEEFIKWKTSFNLYNYYNSDGKPLPVSEWNKQKSEVEMQPTMMMPSL